MGKEDIPKRVTIYDPDKDMTKEYEVMGTNESGSRGFELKYGKDDLVYGLCSFPKTNGRVKSSTTSGRVYTYHYE